MIIRNPVDFPQWSEDVNLHIYSRQ